MAQLSKRQPSCFPYGALVQNRKVSDRSQSCHQTTLLKRIRRRRGIEEATLVAIPLPVLCEVVWNLSRGYKLARDDIADALTVLVEADNVKVNRGAVDSGLVMLRCGGDFADGVIAYEGLTLGGEVFATFDKKAVAILKKHSTIRTRLLS